MKNTKLTFYCTHAEYGGFKKSIFNTVLSDSFEDIYEARDWVDNQVSKIYNDFDLDLVFDWVVINSHETDEDLKEVELVETISGKLVFDDEIIKKVKKTSKPEVKKFQTKATVQKQYKSVWINPYGKSFEVAFAGHNEFASHWLKINDKEAWKESRDSYGYYYEMLQKKGWCRILGWTDPPTFVLPTDMRPKLKNAIRSYCISNNLKGTDFPEILKS